MRVRWITPAGVEERSPRALPALLADDGGFVWLDIPTLDDAARAVLTDVFAFHPFAIRECEEQATVPKVHGYRDHWFAVLHGIEPVAAGELGIYELCQFISLTYLVTVHGQRREGITEEVAFRDTRAVEERLRAGRFLPHTPGELGHAIVAGLARRMDAHVATLAARVSTIERHVMRGAATDPDEVLDELFALRHELLTVRTIAVQSREVYARMSALGRALPGEVTVWLDDLLDHFERLANVCDGEKELLQEVLDLFQTRIAHELNEFVKRLTSVGAILVVDTLIAGIYGMNFRHMPELGWRLGYAWSLGLMLVASLALAAYFRRKRWL